MSDEATDVVVIGAGIVGVSAAMTLAKGGATVTVLERGEVAGQASGLNAGMIAGGGWGSDPDIEVALKMGSREIFVDLSEVQGHDIELDLTGSLTLIQTTEEWSWAEGLVQASQAAGRCLELLDRPAVAALVPTLAPGVKGAVFDPLGARADPVLATTAIAAEAASAGASIHTGQLVTQLRPGPQGWEIDVLDSPEATELDANTATSTMTKRADAVIVAAGPWIAELCASLHVQVPIVAVRGQMWASEPAPPLLSHAIAAAESAVAWAGESAAELASAEQPPSLTHRGGRRLTRHLYGRQRANGEIIFGGDRVLSNSRSVDANGIGANHRHIGELVPAVGELGITRTWAGLMPFSLDGRPLVGPVPDMPGLFVAGGLASSGFGRGPMAGRLIASMLLGADPLPHYPGVDVSSIGLRGRVRGAGTATCFRPDRR